VPDKNEGEKALNGIRVPKILLQVGKTDKSLKDLLGSHR